MSRILPILMTLLVIIVVGVGGFQVLKLLEPEAELADEPPAGLSVFAERVERKDLQYTIEAQGEVRPRREIVVAPQISGRIAFVSPDFIDGGFIRKGQVLVRLEAADYELGVVRAQSGVASAQQRLAREQAESEIALQDLEALGISESSPLARREPQLAEAQASLDSAKAQLADAKLALARTAVTSPFDGRVRAENVEVGQFASPGQSLGTIFATDVVEVVLPITDAQLGQIGLPLAFAASEDNPGPAVTFSGRVGGQERIWEGRVSRTSASVNPQTRLINIISQLDDPYGEGASDGAPMAPGLFVTAKIKGAMIEGLLVAPRGALRSGNKVFIGNGEDGTLAVHEVEVVYSDPDGAWFKSGEIEAGDLAITSPIQAAFDGMSITVLEKMPDGSIYTHSDKTDPPVFDDMDMAGDTNLTEGAN